MKTSTSPCLSDHDFSGSENVLIIKPGNISSLLLNLFFLECSPLTISALLFSISLYNTSQASTVKVSSGSKNMTYFAVAIFIPMFLGFPATPLFSLE